jgi:hypothetical protein
MHLPLRAGKRLALLLGLACLGFFHAPAQTSALQNLPLQLPPAHNPTFPIFTRIDDGYFYWRTAGYRETFRVWSRGGLLENDKAFLSKVDSFADIMAALGTYVDHRILTVVPSGPSTYVIYDSARFEKGSVFFRFVVYTRYQDKFFNRIQWSLDPAEILPEYLMAGGGQ